MFRFAAAFSKPSTLAQTVIRLGAVAAACSALTWSLSGCGGGSRAKEYVPSSVVSFGDENSALETFNSPTHALKDGSGADVPVKGLVYTFNAVTSDAPVYCNGTSASEDKACPSLPVAAPVDFVATASVDTFTVSSTGYFIPDATLPNLVVKVEKGTAVAPTGSLKRTTSTGYFCNSSRLWNQVVAHSFNKGFSSQCDLDRDGAVSYAAFGHKIADMAAQVAAHRAELHDGVLVTIMIGQNDILELLQAVQNHSKSESEARQDLANRAVSLASIVKDVLSTGAKVVLAYPPDLGQSPLALNSGGYQNLLTAFMHDDALGFIPSLRRSLGNAVLQDGRHFAVVETNTLTSLRSSAYVYAPNRLCDPNATYTRPDGSTETLDTVNFTNAYTLVKYCRRSEFVTNGSDATYLWADDIHFAPLGHALIGSTAASRVYNQF